MVLEGAKPSSSRETQSCWEPQFPVQLNPCSQQAPTHIPRINVGMTRHTSPFRQKGVPLPAPFTTQILALFAIDPAALYPPKHPPKAGPGFPVPDGSTALVVRGLTAAAGSQTCWLIQPEVFQLPPAHSPQPPRQQREA